MNVGKQDPPYCAITMSVKGSMTVGGDLCSVFIGVIAFTVACAGAHASTGICPIQLILRKNGTD